MLVPPELLIRQKTTIDKMGCGRKGVLDQSKKTKTSCDRNHCADGFVMISGSPAKPRNVDILPNDIADAMRQMTLQEVVNILFLK